MALLDPENYEINSRNDFNLVDFATQPMEEIDKKKSKEIIEKSVREIADCQERMYANKQRSVLIILQAMDAAGKDGTIERLITGINPQGVQVRNFKAPTDLELRHDFLWRCHLQLPPRGIIGIFNRSHYEEVLVVRVHPEYLIPQDIPGIKSPADVTGELWERRFKMIRNFEQNLVDTGTTILKFFLHISKAEQKERLLDRINEPDKHWKFNINDVEERPYWNDYMHAFEEAVSNTSTPGSPWFVVPGDHKPTARAIVCSTVANKLKALKEDWPQADAKKREEIDLGVELLNGGE